MTALAQGDGFTEKQYEAGADRRAAEERDDLPAPVADAATQAAVEGGPRAATPHDIPIPEHAKVLSYVEVLQGRLRDYIQESLERGASYMPMIQSVFRAEGLPLDLAYIPIIESSFKTNALSKASAKGPWQFMKRDGEGARPQDRLVHRRALRIPRRRRVAAAQYLKTLQQDVRRRLEPGARRRTTAGRAACRARSSARASTTSGSLSATSEATCRARRASTCRSSSPR